MATIVVRGLDKAVKQRLQQQAKTHGRSIEAEIRDILTRAVNPPNIALDLLAAAQSVGGIDELPIPERTDHAEAISLP